MEARHVTVRDKIRTVAARWKEQYKRHTDMPRMTAIGDRLAELDAEACTAKDVNDIIGNTSWTDLSCHGCGFHGLQETVTVGDEEDYDNCYARLCRQCVVAALELFCQ